jgi:hypothetical protein
MSNRHTHGPWHVEPSPDRVHFDIRSDGVHAPLTEANERLIAAAPDLLHALKWAAEYVSLYNGDGAGWTGVQQGHDRDRFIDADTGNFDGEALRAFLEQVIAATEDNA